MGRGKSLVWPQSVPRKEQLSQASGESACKSEWILSSTCFMNHSYPRNKLCRWEQSRVSKDSLTSFCRKKYKSPRFRVVKTKGTNLSKQTKSLFFPMIFSPVYWDFRVKPLSPERRKEVFYKAHLKEIHGLRQLNTFRLSCKHLVIAFNFGNLTW